MTRSQSGRRRTPQQRKRDAQRGRQGQPPPISDVPSAARVAATDDTNGTSEEPRASPARGRRARGRGGLTDEQITALANTLWSLRGRLTLALMVAVLIIPFGLLAYTFSRSTYPYRYSLAYLLVGQLDPKQVIPIPLLLGTFVGMPLARLLAREPRPLRTLETLGFVAVVQLCLTAAWGPLPRSPASYTDAKVVAVGALADAAGLVLGAFVYGPVSYYLSPARRMRKR